MTYVCLQSVNLRFAYVPHVGTIQYTAAIHLTLDVDWNDIISSKVWFSISYKLHWLSLFSERFHYLLALTVTLHPRCLKVFYFFKGSPLMAMVLG